MHAADLSCDRECHLADVSTGSEDPAGEGWWHRFGWITTQNLKRLLPDRQLRVSMKPAESTIVSAGLNVGLPQGIPLLHAQPGIGSK